MRNRCKGRVYERVLRLVEDNYHQLHALCMSRIAVSGQIMSADDIFHETILLVIKDTHANDIFLNDEFVKYFMYRTNMVMYQTTKDNHQEKKNEYAYYKQAKAHTPDEW